jgi:predicted NAD-dependent protein-ADP-ribosyltransferase YbiA (DUF1768 family)
MRVILKPGLFVVTPENAAEREAWAAWRLTMADHVFHLADGTGDGAPFHDLGPRALACRDPINIVFDQVEACWRPISNLAHTPFTLDGRHYASVEGFWQGLKFDKDAERRRVASLWGLDAKKAAGSAPAGASFHYNGQAHPFGGPEHHGLMLQACRAKFAQNLEASEALLATGDRILVHRTPRDSKTIPGALMADIWTRIRATLQR